MKHVGVTFEVDSAYDDPNAVIANLITAWANEESVALHIAGEHFEVTVKEVVVS